MRSPQIAVSLVNSKKDQKGALQKPANHLGVHWNGVPRNFKTIYNQDDRSHVVAPLQPVTCKVGLWMEIPPVNSNQQLSFNHGFISWCDTPEFACPSGTSFCFPQMLPLSAPLIPWGLGEGEEGEGAQIRPQQGLRLIRRLNTPFKKGIRPCLPPPQPPPPSPPALPRPPPPSLCAAPPAPSRPP